MNRWLCRSTLGIALVGCLASVGLVFVEPNARANRAVGVGEDAVAGPRDVASEGAVVASSFDELRAMVADPRGPGQIELLPQIYRGNLVIERPVVIRGQNGAILDGAKVSTVVTVQASNVVIENVVVRNSGGRHTAEDAGIKATGDRIRIAHVRVEQSLFGVSLQACTHCLLEKVHVVGPRDDDSLRGDGIKLWEAHDSVVRGCIVEYSRDMVVWYSRRTTVENNIVRHSRYGSHFMYAHDAVVRGGKYHDNVVGIFVMYSRRLNLENNILAGARGAAGVGLGFKDSDAISIRGNWLVANTVGTYLDNTPRTLQDPVTFDGNVIALNDVALRLHGSEKGLTLTGNDFRQNSTLLEVDGGGNALGVDIRSNHYSDYEGYDIDGNGVGDVAHEVKALSSELTQTRPTIAFFRGTAAMGLVDAVARAVPAFASRKIFVDPTPLVNPPLIARP
ncbi:MAG: nitrous oxide reductase family maturation protein NosD [Polyangiaceae bacterium]|nr:nitrous oxide reductase family maturation protein NosD [Polyangiaceae bacterium]